MVGDGPAVAHHCKESIRRATPPHHAGSPALLRSAANNAGIISNTSGCCATAEKSQLSAIRAHDAQREQHGDGHHPIVIGNPVKR
jgi:hypothetical protein